MAFDPYADDEPLVEDHEIQPSARLMHAPDWLLGIHQGWWATHHQGADYGEPDTTVTVVDGVQCTYGGEPYGGGETVRVPRAVADYWFRSGWATAESDANPGPAAHDEATDTVPAAHDEVTDTVPAAHDEVTDTVPAAHDEVTEPEPATPAKTPAKQARAGSGRRATKQ